MFKTNAMLPKIIKHFNYKMDMILTVLKFFLSNANSVFFENLACHIYSC